MKKLLLAAISLFGIMGHLFAQTESVYYYYQGKKIYVPATYRQFVVGLKQATPSAHAKTSLAAQLQIPADSVKPTSTPNQFVIRLSAAQAFTGKAMAGTLTGKDNVAYVHPCLSGQAGRLVSYGDAFVVKLKTGTLLSRLKTLVNTQHCTIIKPAAADRNTWLISAGPRNNYDALKMANIFFETSLFEYSQPDFTTYGGLADAPNDPLYNLQWAHHNTGSPEQYNGVPGDDMQVDSAWLITEGDSTIKIAVIDTGVDTAQADLKKNLLQGYDCISQTSNPGDGAPRNLANAHGTACAGIVAALANNNTGMAGIAPKCKIIPVNINSESDVFASDFSIASGFDYSWQNGAAVITNSWTNGLPSGIIDDAIHRAVTQGRGGKGCVVFFAAGNDNAGIAYPSTNPEVIAVGGSNMYNQHKTPTSYDGEDWWGANYGGGLDVVAPCVKIVTTDISGANGYNTGAGTNGDYYLLFNGTSAASPHAAAVAALVLSANKDLSSAEVRNIIESNCTKSGNYVYTLTQDNFNGTWNNEMGYGIVNAYKSVLAAKSKKFCNAGIAAPAATTLCKNGSIKLTVVDSSAAAIFNWRLNGTSFKTGASINVSGPGTYDVVASYANGCTAYTAGVTIHAADTAALQASAGKPVSLCPGTAGAIIGGLPSAAGGTVLVAAQRGYGYDLLHSSFIRFNTNNPREYKFVPVGTLDGITSHAFIAGDFTPMGYYAVTNAGQLARIDTATGYVRLIGNLASGSSQYASHNWSGLAFNPVNQKLYGLTGGGLANTVYEIDMVTAKTTPVANLVNNSITWITFNNSGTLFGFNPLYNKVMCLSLTGGSAIFVSDVIGVTSIVQLDASRDPLDSKLYLTTYAFLQNLVGDLRAVDTLTGKVTVQGGIATVSEVAALAIAGGTYKYSWSPSAGLSNAHDANPVAKPNATTTYTLTVTDACGTQATSQVVVTANAPKPPVTITADRDSICLGDSSHLSVTKNSNYIYQWVYNGGSISTPMDTSYTSGRGGKFQVSVTDGPGGCANTSKTFVLKDCSVWLKDDADASTCYSYFYPPNGYTDTGFRPKQAFTKTIYPATPGTKMQVTFKKIVLGALSHLAIYDGPNTSSPLLKDLGFYDYSTTDVVYSSSNGPLTFQLTAGPNADDIGTWDAFLTCYSPQVYRSKKSGVYEDAGTWKIKNSDGTYSNALAPPTYIQDSIIISKGDTVTKSTYTFAAADELWVQKGALLVCAGNLSITNHGKFGLIADGDIEFKTNGSLAGWDMYIRGNLTSLIKNNQISGTLYIDGTSPQTFVVNNLHISSLHVNNKKGLTIQGPWNVDSLFMQAVGGNLYIDSTLVYKALYLQNGIINVSPGKVLDLTGYGNVYISGGSNKSYITGATGYTSNYGKTVMQFPVGSSGIYRPATLSIKKTSVPYNDFYAINVLDSVPVLPLPAGIDRVSTLHYYKITSAKNYGFDSATVTINYNADDNVTDPANLRVVRDSASHWVNEGGVGSQISNGYITSAINFKTMGSFALANSTGGGNALPVTWLSFTATPQNKNVLLQWSVTNEVNCAHYTAEYSSDGVHFTSLAQLAAYSNSSGYNVYQYLHVSPLPGIDYYRIKETDKDGKYAYSKIISIHINDNSSYLVTPNPARDAVTITAPAVIKEIDCYNAAGQLVKKILPATAQYKLSVKNLAVGIYTLRIITAIDVHNTKVVKE